MPLIKFVYHYEYYESSLVIYRALPGYNRLEKFIHKRLYQGFRLIVPSEQI